MYSFLDPFIILGIKGSSSSKALAQAKQSPNTECNLRKAIVRFFIKMNLGATFWRGEKYFKGQYFMVTL